MQKKSVAHLDVEKRHRQEELLAVLEALTDPAITHLALDDLFHAVLDRICTITKADNLAVLLLNKERTALQIRAVRGVEEAVAGDVLVPFGKGFAGRIAAQAIPITCYEPSTSDIITPVLRKELRALLGVPLFVQGQVIGVLHIGVKRDLRFTDYDITLLTRVADCLANAIERARLVEVEQKARNEAIGRANELETIFETLTDGLVVYDPQGNILHSNSTARQILGVKDGTIQFAADSLMERVAAYQIRDEYGQLIAFNDLPVKRLLRGERLMNSTALPMRLNTPDGQEALLTMTGAPYYDQHGQICGAVCLLRDITEQKYIQRRIDIFDALIEIVETLVQYSVPESPTGLSTTTVATVIQHIGHTILTLAQPLLGYSHALILEIQVETQNLSVLEMIGFLKEQEDLLRSALAGVHLTALIADPQTRTQLERQESAPFDISQSPLLQQLFPMHTSPDCLLTPIYIASHLVGLLGIAFADRTYKLSAEDHVLIVAISRLCALAIQYGQQAVEQDRLYEARDLLNKELERVNELQSTFISMVGHEFRTALTSIEGFSNLLVEEEFTPEEAKDFARDINKDALRLHHMITNLLDLEQMKKGKMQLHLECIDINSVLEDAAKRIRLTKPAYVLQLHLDPKIPLLQGDPDKLVQVISNLLSNAVKYSPNGGEIIISSTLEEEVVHLCFQDYGIGIPPERMKDIFTPYQRVASMSTRHIQGTGLGLGITKQIVEMHQGTIWVESIFGQGSLFHVTLPLNIQES